ncbi:hypothetical protein BU17DRAFT_64789 [Hysterangium stoloniferum]|nr:hypothetical protein BU17DRAFT_64789 [Hysterangium stoloniferum]
MERATEEAARRGVAESVQQEIEQDLDGLSAKLFGRANAMVAEARLAAAKSERKVQEAEAGLRGAEGPCRRKCRRCRLRRNASWVERDAVVAPSPPPIATLLPLPFLTRLVAEDSLISILMCHRRYSRITDALHYATTTYNQHTVVAPYRVGLNFLSLKIGGSFGGCRTAALFLRACFLLLFKKLGQSSDKGSDRVRETSECEMIAVWWGDLLLSRNTCVLHVRKEMRMTEY